MSEALIDHDDQHAKYAPQDDGGTEEHETQIATDATGDYIEAGVNRAHEDGSTIVPRIVMISLHAVSVAFSTWLLVGGVTTLHASWRVHVPFRAYAMLVCLWLVWGKHAGSLKWIIKRKVQWAEALPLALFSFPCEVGMALLATGLDGKDRPGWPALVTANGGDYAAVAVYAVGWIVSTWAEVDRMLWKRDPANKGKCYTGGLWRYSAHINYFGETLMWSAIATLTAVWWTAWLPLSMAAGFVWYHIPGLDKYLSQRYGAEFDEYQRTTSHFIPFVY